MHINTVCNVCLEGTLFLSWLASAFRMQSKIQALSKYLDHPSQMHCKDEVIEKFYTHKRNRNIYPVNITHPVQFNQLKYDSDNRISYSEKIVISYLQQIQSSMYYTSVPFQKVHIHYLPGFGLIFFMDYTFSWSMLCTA